VDTGSGLCVGGSRRFLRESIKNGSGGQGNHCHREARNDENTHDLSPLTTANSTHPSRSSEREGFGLDLHERAAERSHARVKTSRLSTLQIGEETSDPRREMRLEDLTLGFHRCGSL